MQPNKSIWNLCAAGASFREYGLDKVLRNRLLALPAVMVRKLFSARSRLLDPMFGRGEYLSV